MRRGDGDWRGTSQSIHTEYWPLVLGLSLAALLFLLPGGVMGFLESRLRRHRRREARGASGPGDPQAV